MNGQGFECDFNDYDGQDCQNEAESVELSVGGVQVVAFRCASHAHAIGKSDLKIASLLAEKQAAQA